MGQRLLSPDGAWLAGLGHPHDLFAATDGETVALREADDLHATPFATDAAGLHPRLVTSERIPLNYSPKLHGDYVAAAREDNLGSIWSLVDGSRRDITIPSPVYGRLSGPIYLTDTEVAVVREGTDDDLRQRIQIIRLDSLL